MTVFKYNKIIALGLFCSVFAFTGLIFQYGNSADAAPGAPSVSTPGVPGTVYTKSYIFAKPLQVVQNPNRFFTKNVKMNATFDKFTTLGLDYNKAMRKSTDYIGFLIQRDDVTGRDVPLSEMKLFLKRDYAEKFIDLDTGDRIEILGHMFSNALGDSWIDVEKLTILSKAKTDKEPIKK